MMLGSTANYVLHHTERPVVVVRGDHTGPPRHVVVGVDDHDLSAGAENESVRAVRWAYGLTGVEEVHVVHAWFLPALAVGMFSTVAAEMAGAGLGPETRIFTRWAALAARRARTVGDPGELAAARESLDRAFEAFLERWRVAELRPGGYGILQFGESQTLLSERILTALALDGAEAGARRGLGDIVRVQALGSYPAMVSDGLPQPILAMFRANAEAVKGELYALVASP